MNKGEQYYNESGLTHLKAFNIVALASAVIGAGCFLTGHEALGLLGAAGSVTALFRGVAGLNKAEPAEEYAPGLGQ